MRTECVAAGGLVQGVSLPEVAGAVERQLWGTTVRAHLARAGGVALVGLQAMVRCVTIAAAHCAWVQAPACVVAG